MDDSIQETKAFIPRGFQNLNQILNAIILAVITGSVCIFGYFALGVTSDPLSCMASKETNEIWTKGDQTGFVQIGQTFKQSLNWAFAMSLTQLVLVQDFFSGSNAPEKRQRLS